MNNIIVCLDDLPQNRLTVKATPTMQLQTILEMACTKFQLDPKEWGLRYKKTPMDLSLPIRFSSLPASGTRLDLFRLSASQKAGAAQAAMVNVAVQLDEGGGRVTEKFPSDFTIWQVLLAIESRSQGQLNLTKRAAASAGGKISAVFNAMIKGSSTNPPASNSSYMMPCCMIMSREYNTLDQLQSTTLRQAGLSGSGVIRVMFRTTDQSLASMLPLIERAAESPTTTTTTTAAAAATATDLPVPITKLPAPPKQTLAEIQQAPDDVPIVSVPSTTEPLQHDNVPAAEQPLPPTNAIDRQARIFRLPEGISAAKIDLPDAFFELSSVELKRAAQLASERRRTEEERPLMTRAMRDKAEAERERRYPKSMIRIRFSDGPLLLLQGSFLTAEKVGDIYEFVRQFLQNPNAPFYLYTTPPMQKLIGSEVLEKNLFQAQLAPAALIHFMPEHEDARLSSQAWERVEELAPHRTLTEWVENAPAAAVPILEPSALIDDDRSAPRAMTAATAGTINSSYNAANGRSGVPKWFKMPLAKK